MLKDANDRLALMQKLQRDPTQGVFSVRNGRLERAAFSVEEPKVSLDENGSANL